MVSACFIDTFSEGNCYSCYSVLIPTKLKESNQGRQSIAHIKLQVLYENGTLNHISCQNIWSVHFMALK